jgi:hypothetical protein
LYPVYSRKMKTAFFILIIVLLSLNSCKTIKPVVSKQPEIPAVSGPVPDINSKTVDFSEQSTFLLGYFNPRQLYSYPYSTWYYKGFDEYKVDNEAFNKLIEISKGEITIKIVMGTWCPDSRREVPRFMRILNMWQFPLDKVTFIGVDNAKLSPVGEYDKLEIHRVPTFILYKNNIEAGRIIENPITSLEQDMVNILTGSNNK